MSSPLPTFYFHVFASLNAVVTLLGAAAALFASADLFRDLMPDGHDLLGDAYAKSGSTRLALNGIAVGNIYLLLGCLYIALPRVLRRMSDRPDYQLTIMWWFLFCTIWSEVIQFIGNLYMLPASLQSPSTWGPKLGFKMWYQIFISGMKAAYLLGIGRGNGKMLPSAKKRN